MSAKCLAVHSLDVPANLQSYLARIGGSNLLGGPKFRLVWSGNRFSWTNRKWTIPGDTQRATSVKYGPGTTLKYKQKARRERFIVEVYHPPWESGDPDTWAQQYSQYMDGRIIMPAGPFPSRGEYEYLDTCETVDADGTRHFLMPTEAYLDMVVLLHNQLVAAADWEKRAAIDKQDEQERAFKYNTILERVKTATNPHFSPTQVALDNLAALRGPAATGNDLVIAAA